MMEASRFARTSPPRSGGRTADSDAFSTTLVLSGGILVLLVLGHEVVHVGLGLSELHPVHALTGVPVEEGLAAEHASELLRDTLPELLDGSGVADEDGGHLEALGG